MSPPVDLLWSSSGSGFGGLSLKARQFGTSSKGKPTTTVRRWIGKTALHRYQISNCFFNFSSLKSRKKLSGSREYLGGSEDSEENRKTAALAMS